MTNTRFTLIDALATVSTLTAPGAAPASAQRTPTAEIRADPRARAGKRYPLSTVTCFAHDSPLLVCKVMGRQIARAFRRSDGKATNLESVAPVTTPLVRIRHSPIAHRRPAPPRGLERERFVAADSGVRCAGRDWLIEHTRLPLETRVTKDAGPSRARSP